MGSSGIGSAVFGALGQHAHGAKYWAPSKHYLDALQGYQRSDMANLHGAHPFDQPGLGFNDAEMMAKIGTGVDQARTEYNTNLGSIEQGAALEGPGGASATSGAYLRNRQRAAGGLLGRSAETRRSNVIANAGQKRSDLYNRMGMTANELGEGTSLYNAIQQQNAARRQAPYAAAGKLADAAISYGTGGMM
jgi:hypothetical protein